MLDLAGVYPALTTPFAADGAVSLEGMKHNIGRYNQTALAGYVVLGSTGESVLLRSKEMDGVFEAVKQTAAPGKKLLAGLARNPQRKPLNERSERLLWDMTSLW